MQELHTEALQLLDAIAKEHGGEPVKNALKAYLDFVILREK